MEELPNENWDVESLIEALNSCDSSKRLWAAMSLAEVGDNRAVTPLIRILEEDENEDLRQFAAFSLGKIEDERAIIPLIRALNDVDKDVGTSSAKALLGFSNKKKIKEGVKSILCDIQSDNKIKRRILDAIEFLPELQQIFKEVGSEEAIENRVFVSVKSKNVGDLVIKVLEENNLFSVTVEDMSKSNISKSVQSCGFGIFETSNTNFGVGYEIGVMHALSKPCVVLKTVNEELLPISETEYLNYSSLQDLEKKLSTWIDNRAK